MFIEIKIGKRRCPAILDTGSEVTLLPKQLADMSQLNRSSRTLRAANGTLINIVGEWETLVTIGPVTATLKFIVSDQIDELLIGIDWMRDNSCVLSFADLTLELQGYLFPLVKKSKSGLCNRVILEEGVVLPARSEAMVSGKLVYADLRKRLPPVGITGNERGIYSGSQDSTLFVRVGFRNPSTASSRECDEPLCIAARRNDIVSTSRSRSSRRGASRVRSGEAVGRRPKYK